MESGLMIDEWHYQDLIESRFENFSKDEKKKAIIEVKDVILSQFKMVEDYQSVFFKMMNSDQDIYQEKYKIDPFYKPGLRFGLFVNNKYQDSKIDSLEIDFEKDALKLIGEKKLLIRQLNEKQDMIENSQLATMQLNLDSLDWQFDERYEIHKAMVDSLISNKYDLILDAFYDRMEIAIDEVDYKDSLECKFCFHETYGQKGLLCFWNSEYLSKGHHQFEISMDYFLRNTDENAISAKAGISKEKLNLPFIKVK